MTRWLEKARWKIYYFQWNMTYWHLKKAHKSAPIGELGNYFRDKMETFIEDHLTELVQARSQLEAQIKKQEEDNDLSDKTATRH